MATHSSILAWEISMDRGAWWATVHKVAKSRTRLNRHSTHVLIGLASSQGVWSLGETLEVSPTDTAQLSSQDVASTASAFCEMLYHLQCDLSVRTPFEHAPGSLDWGSQPKQEGHV